MENGGDYAIWRFSRGFWIAGGPAELEAQLRPSFQKLFSSAHPIPSWQSSLKPTSRRVHFVEGIEKSLAGGFVGNPRFPEFKYLGPLAPSLLAKRLQGDGSGWLDRLPLGALRDVRDARLLPLELVTHPKRILVESHGPLTVSGGIWCSVFLCRYLVLTMQFVAQTGAVLTRENVEEIQQSLNPAFDDPTTTLKLQKVSGTPNRFAESILSGLAHSLAGTPCLTPATDWYAACGTHGESNADFKPRNLGRHLAAHPRFGIGGHLQIYERGYYFHEPEEYLTKANELKPIALRKTLARIKLVSKMQDIVGLQRSILNIASTFAHTNTGRLREARTAGSVELILSDQGRLGRAAASLLGLVRSSDAVMGRDNQSTLPWQRSIYSRFSKAHRIPRQRSVTFKAMRGFEAELRRARFARTSIFVTLGELVGRVLTGPN